MAGLIRKKCCCGGGPAVCLDTLVKDRSPAYENHPTSDQAETTFAGWYLAGKDTLRNGVSISYVERATHYLVQLDRSLTPPSGAPGGTPPVTVNPSYLASLASWLKSELGFVSGVQESAYEVADYGANLGDGSPRYSAIGVKFLWQPSIFNVPTHGGGSTLYTYEQDPLDSDAVRFTYTLPQAVTREVDGTDYSTRTSSYTAGDSTATFATVDPDDGTTPDDAGEWQATALDMGGCLVDVYQWAIDQTGAHDPSGEL
jgi:hypothetical protein